MKSRYDLERSLCFGKGIQAAQGLPITTQYRGWCKGGATAHAEKINDDEIPFLNSDQNHPGVASPEERYVIYFLNVIWATNEFSLDCMCVTQFNLMLLI